jgi:hypothetical protein
MFGSMLFTVVETCGNLVLFSDIETLNMTGIANMGRAF